MRDRNLMPNKLDANIAANSHSFGIGGSSLSFDGLIVRNLPSNQITFKFYIVYRLSSN